MADADFQAKLGRALTWAGIWSPPQHAHPIEDRHKTDWDGRSLYTCATCVEVFHFPPCPSLTDELAMRLLRAVRNAYYWPRLYGDGAGFSCLITDQNNHLQHREWAGLNRSDPAEAIVLAVAALAEAAQGAPNG